MIYGTLNYINTRGEKETEVLDTSWLPPNEVHNYCDMLTEAGCLGVSGKWEDPCDSHVYVHPQD